MDTPDVSSSAWLSRLDWQALSRCLKLSPRESRIVYLMASDWSEPDIARELAISAHTVHSHKERVYRKLQVRSRCALLLRVIEAWLTLGIPMRGS